MTTASPKQELTKLTKSQELTNDVRSYIRARTPLLWVVTREEARVEAHLLVAIIGAGYKPCTWDVAQGIIMAINSNVSVPNTVSPDDALAKIQEWAMKRKKEECARYVWIMRDLPPWLQGPPGARTLRQLRNLVRMLPGVPREAAQSIIVLSPSADVPPELSVHATVIEWPLPDRSEVAGLLTAAIETVSDIPASALSNGARENIIDAAIGLSGEEVQACFAKSISKNKGRIDPVTVGQEKRRVVAREGLLEWCEPLPGGLKAVGGLDQLKRWLVVRKHAYSPQARSYGLPAPKGALITGIPGTGKTLTAKATATAWEVPLVRMDLGALKSKFVGESERNLRKAFEVISAIGRCVVWLDEIEKALQGATSGSADGGVSSDALGAILSWMQERQGEAFVIATANDISGLPPELLRKGRFDEVWFVDLPNTTECVEILKAALRVYSREKVKIDYLKVISNCERFTGSEIATLVPEALFSAFEDGGREINTKDLCEAAKRVVPLSKTAEVKIAALRKWASDGNARFATSREGTRQELSSTRIAEFEEE